MNLYPSLKIAKNKNAEEIKILNLERSKARKSVKANEGKF